MGPRTRLGPVELTVADLARARRFYEEVVGLRTLAGGGDRAVLGAGDDPLLELAGDPDAPPRPPGTTGLFHLALLVPGRAELAAAVRRVVEGGWRLTGASDHFVSEAVYLRDPEGNGIEIYRDRPRSAWRYAEDGELRMGTVALDLDAVMAELPPGEDAGMAPGTVMGHVHLEVADLASTEAFYAGDLGLDVTVRSYPGALFLSAGGYHHHLGANTWAGEGAPAPPPGARGLRRFSFRVPDAPQRELTDPSGNRLLVGSPER